jgi:hypothetical protein
MFKRLVTLVRGLMGCQSTAPSTSQAEQPLPSAKRLRAKSTPTSPQAALNPVKLKPKRKSKAAQPTTAVVSRKAAPKPAQTTPGNRGLLPKTLAPQTRQPASQAQTPKQKAADSTSAVKKATRSKTSVQIRTVRPSKVSGS